MAVPGPEGLRKWLQCGCWLSACVLYTACSAFFEFFSRIFINQYRFTFPAFIVLCQALLTIVILQLLKRVRLLKIEPYLLERGVRSFNDEVIVYIYGLLNLMLESMYLILLQKICEDQKTSVMDVHYTCTINSCPLLFVYCLLHPETQRIYVSGSWTSLIFLGFFSLVLILGCLLKFLICLCTLLSSALMVSMMVVAKTDALTLRTIIANEWTFSSPQLTTLLISASGIGIFLYKVSGETNISTRKERVGIQL
ncbi:uncharacterized protein si:ch211-248a14.8 isoform X4 [Mobula hypostoma]|uniref:uncharacterized protein si:ch211-248a14.8 isoform X4 n=1 Tax=Mobula hypostoma TaxID=723540 RepID=UPI002FC2D3B6